MSKRMCPKCGATQRIIVDTNGHGALVDMTPECPCVVRKRAGLCRDCLSPVHGMKGRAIYCTKCKKSRQYESVKRWRESNPDWEREWIRENREKRTRWKRRWERNNPDKVKAQRRRQALKADEKALQARREWYAANKERLNARDRERNKQRREQMNEYKRVDRQLRPEIHKARDARKRVYFDRDPVCTCGAVIEWNRKGRPHSRCAECRERRAA